VEGNVAVGAFFKLVDLAGIKGLGVDVDADGALIVFGEIEDLVDGFERINVDGICGIHFVDVGRDEPTRAGVVGEGVAVFDSKILHFEAADGSGHPAILVAMIVDTAELADFPTNGHAFEKIIFEDKVASVTALGEMKIFVERFGTDVMARDVFLHIAERKISGGDGGEFFDPVRDGDLGGGEVVGHEVPPRDYTADEGKQ
jgi:hypothetical protein